MPPSSSTAQTTLKRIHREIADLKKENMGDISLGPSGDSLFEWKGTIHGPSGSIYEGGVFNIDLHLGTDYPFSAPRATFRTRIYHMNISERGGVCIDILKHNWSPALSLYKVMLSLSSLLTDPNPKDPLVPSIATEFLRNRAQHDRTAREWTRLYAKPPPPPVLEAAPLPATASARAKGKARASATPVPGNGSSSRGPRNAPETITIEDSDDEASHDPRSRQRTVVGKRKRGPNTAEADIDLTTDDSDRGSARRRRTDRGPPRDASDEVIVIED